MKRKLILMLTIMTFTLLPIQAMAASAKDVGVCFKAAASDFQNFRDKSASVYSSLLDAESNRGTIEAYLSLKYQDGAGLDEEDCGLYQKALCDNIQAVKTVQSNWKPTSLPSSVGQCCRLYADLDPTTMSYLDMTQINQFPQMLICSMSYDKSLAYDYKAKANNYHGVMDIFNEDVQGLVRQAPPLASCHFTTSCS